MTKQAAGAGNATGILPRSAGPPRETQERFLRFAFTAADLLVEVGPDGRVRYATGAFAAKLGAPAEAFLDQEVSRLIVPADHAALSLAVAEAIEAGRSAPIVVHLDNASREAVAFAALGNGIPGDGLSITLGRLPESLAVRMEMPLGFDAFRLEATARLKRGVPASLSLIEVDGNGARTSGPEREKGEPGMAGRISAAMADHKAGAVPLFGAIAPGRYGLIADRPVDVGELSRRIEAHCRASGEKVEVSGTGFPLEAGGAAIGDVARALRFALQSFASGGLARVAAGGFSHGLGGFLAQAAEQRNAMQSTIAGRRFELAFQPVVGLADREISHYEALLRLAPAPGRLLPSTQEFVTAAEAAGLAEQLDTAVIEEAIGVLAEVPDAAVAVNVSGLSFQSERFRARLPELLAGLSGAPSRLLVELTETAEIEDIAQARQTLAAFRERGIPVCLDDFGAGAAALRYLREFRADYIKIDGSFLRAAAQSARERAMLGAMVTLARNAGAKVVVEMIENPEEEELSREIGADLGQGWLYGRPGRLPGSALRHLTEARRPHTLLTAGQ